MTVLNTARLDRFLDLLASARPSKECSYTLDVFHGAEPMLPDLFFMNASDRPQLLDTGHYNRPKPMDISFAVPSTGKNEEEWTALVRVRSIRGRQIARLGGDPKKPTVVHHMVLLNENGRWDPLPYAGDLLQWDEKTGWRLALRPGRFRAREMEFRDMEERIVRHADTAHARTEQRETDWRVVIAEEGSPGLSFVTDPAGCLSAFRLRDKPPGAKRRASLLHWVSQHHRQQGGKDGAEVRAHLRGAQKFSWNGLVVELFPSLRDADESEASQRSIAVTEPGTT